MKNASFIIFKGHKITRTKALNNIKAVLSQANAEDLENNWYAEAYKISVRFSQHLKYPICESISKSCGIVAALSPIKSWDENVNCARTFVKNGHAKHTGIFVEKAEAILNSDGSEEAILSILNGPKISSFYHNIKNHKTSDKVTIDRHALSCIFGAWITDEFYKGMTKNQYNFFESCFQYAGEKLGYQPSQLQAITWTAFRRIKNTYPRITRKGEKLTDNQKSLTNFYGTSDKKVCPF